MEEILTFFLLDTNTMKIAALVRGRSVNHNSTTNKDHNTATAFLWTQPVIIFWIGSLV